MRVRAYYNTYIKPLNAELIDDKLMFSNDDIPIIVKDITKTNEEKEYIKGLKEDEYRLSVVVENDTFDKTTNIIKVKDRVFIYGEEYRVKNVIEKITDPKFSNKIARSPHLYNRYVKKVLILE